MGKRKYRTVAAAVLAGAALFSPLLCGMTCLETGGIRPSAEVESAPWAAELVLEFVGNGLVGCVVSHLVSKIDVSEWADQMHLVA